MYLSMEAQLGQVAFLGVDLKVKMKAGNTNSCSQCNQNSRTNHDSVISTSTLESKPRPQALPSFSSLAVHQNGGGSGIFPHVSHTRMIEMFDWMWAHNSKNN